MKKLLLSLLMVSCGLCSFAQSDYTIEFNKVSSSNDGSGITAKSTKVSAAVTTESAEYVDGTFTQAERAYYNSKNGLKFGTGSGTGSTTFALSSKGQFLASALIVNAASYSSSDTNTSVMITINGTDEYETVQFTKTDLADYTITFSSPTVIESIKLESKGTIAKKSRVYIGALTVIASSSSSDLTPAGLSFPEATYSATLGQEFTAPVLTNPNDLAVTYSSSDPAVATINPATGLISLHRGGTTTITATSEATDTYEAGSATYTLNVTGVVANISEFLTAANAATNTIITGNVTVTCQNGPYLFLQDSTGALQVYGALTKTYTNGTILSNIAGKYNEYNKMPQMAPDASTFTDGTEGTPVEPADVNPADIQLAQYVRLTDVKITETNGKFYVDDLQLYNQFNIDGLEFQAAEKATITGFGALYNTTKEIIVTEIIYTELPAVHLGSITLNGTPVSTATNYQFFENTPLTIACENAEELVIEIRDETDTPVTDNTFVDSYTWTPAAPGTYSATVLASGCDELREANFTITILEKPAAEVYEGYNYKKITSEADLTDEGKYVIISEPFKLGAVQYGTYIMAAAKTSNKGFDAIELSATSEAPHNGYDLSSVSGYTELTLNSTDDNSWTLTSMDDNAVKYLEGSTKSNLKWNEEKKTVTISFNAQGQAVITTGKDGTKDITLQFYGQNSSSKAGNQSFNAYSSSQHPIYLYKRVNIEKPTLMVDGAPVDLDDNYDLRQGSVTITLTAPEGHHIYYKHVAAGTTENVRAKVVTDDDYTVVENNVATIEINTNGTLHFHSLHPETGLKSDTRTLTFVGATTSIEAIASPAETSPAEIFDLQGRRVTTAPRRGLYIIKQGSNVSKRAL